MEDTNTLTNRLNKTTNTPEVLRLTALLYLQEAVAKQRYEECEELIALAKEFGAEQVDITIVLVQSALGVMKPIGGNVVEDPVNRLEAFEI